MFLLKPPMCNSSLLRVRKEKTVKATYWGRGPVKGKERPQPCSQKEKRHMMSPPEDTCLHTRPIPEILVV